MNILAINTTLTAETEVADLNELAARLDVVHENLTANSAIKSADLVADGGHAIHALVSFFAEEGEAPEDTAARGDKIMNEAFLLGKITTNEGPAAQSSIVVQQREFALV